LVEYKVGDVDTEVSKEATNDGQPESWVLEGEHALKKKVWDGHASK